MRWNVSSKRDLVVWAENTLDVSGDEARRVADAVWAREDFPHPVNNTDLGEYLAGLDDSWLAEAAGVAECAYCGHVVPNDVVPPTSDDAAWAEIAEAHGDGCEWVETRAHRAGA